MKKAVIIGSAMASFVVEKFGVERLREVNEADIQGRLAKFVSLTNFDLDKK
jgi:hypothetical protein